jgi:hypothetical protein
MNTIQLEQSASPRLSERRRRWKKRRDFDRAFHMSGVALTERLVVQPGLYRSVNICNCISPLSKQPTAAEPSAEPT